MNNQTQLTVAFIGVIGLGTIGGIYGVIVACCAQQKTEPLVVPSYDGDDGGHYNSTVPFLSHEPTIAEQVSSAQNLPQAFAMCKSLTDMGETDELSTGGLCLAHWGATHGMSYKDVHVAKDEVTPGLVMKNPQAYLGLKICATGTLIELHDQRGGITLGEIQSYSSWIYHFYNVGGSGSLEGLHEAHMCGVVVGIYSYSNSGGGTTHTVDLVGAFDLSYRPSEY